MAGERAGVAVEAEDRRTPWRAARDRAEETGDWPEGWGPFHRHFANDAVHRDGGPECDQPGTPRRVYVFDEEYLEHHEAAVAAHAARQLAGDLARCWEAEAAGIDCGPADPATWHAARTLRQCAAGLREAAAG